MEISVTVVPNAREPEITSLGGHRYKAKVDAPAVDGKANKRLIGLLAEHFNVRGSRIRITSGMRSRNKVVEVDGPLP